MYAALIMQNNKVGVGNCGAIVFSNSWKFVVSFEQLIAISDQLSYAIAEAPLCNFPSNMLTPVWVVFVFDFLL